MKGLCWEHFWVKTPWKPEDVRRALRRNTAQERFSWAWAQGHLLYGKIPEDKWAFTVTTRGFLSGNSWRPVWEISLWAEEDGWTRVEVKARCNRFIQIFTAAWLGGWLFYWIRAIATRGAFTSVPLWPLLFVAGICGLGFWSAESQNKEKLCRIIQGRLV